jgi:uncharacterized membrane protein YfcA
MILAAFLGGFVGLVLGVLGGGGSTLTVPLLVLGLGFDEKHAIAAGLFVVAVTAMSGAIPRWLAGAVDWRAAAIFGACGAAASWTASFAAHDVDPAFQMHLLAATMAIAGVLLLVRKSTGTPHRAPWPRVLATATAAGALTGITGVGGGFILVPSLVLGAGLVFDRAVATSLVVITCNAVFGWLGAADRMSAFTPQVLVFTAGAIVVAVVSGRHSPKIAPLVRQRVLAVLLCSVGIVLALR